MTLPLQAVDDPATDQNFRQIAQKFPLQGGDLANKSVSDAMLAKPVIAGAISKAGAIQAGSGFTAEKTATGVYKITLSTELATDGVMLISSQLEGAEIIACSGPSKKVFEAKGFSTALAAKDMNFNFHIKAT